MRHINRPFKKYGAFLWVLVLLCCLTTTRLYAYDQPYIGTMKTIQATYGDTFPYIARDYNLGYVELITANPTIDPWLPGEGTEITLPLRHILPEAPQNGIVINLAEMRLYAFLDNQMEPITFPIGIGREGLETPTGTTIITRKVDGPTWHPTARMREEDPSLPEFVGPGAKNPLGTHALYLGWPEYLIHGTNRPFGIGRRVSSGCMRMYPEAITRLYTLIPVDTPVTIVDQPIKAAWIGDELYLEAHTTMKQALEIEETQGSITDEVLTLDEINYIKGKAGENANNLNWDEINQIVKRRSGIPTPILHKNTEEPQEKAP